LAVVRLRVICGPTAAGKSALVWRLAERFPLAVVSADSRQIYRGFDIGTGKPTAAEQARVPHFGIDVAEPEERYSAARWAESARAWMSEARAAGRTPVIVGGTGFYIRALTAPLFAQPPMDEGRRRSLAAWSRSLTVDQLRAWIARLDPERAHLGRAQLLRAIEVALLTGVPLSRWHAEGARAAVLPARYLLVDPGAPLRGAIVERAERMLEGGWVEEAEALARRVTEDAPAWNATGYRAVRELARHRSEVRTVLERVVVSTRQYAKRQRTWFRHQLPAGTVTRLDPVAPDALERAVAWWTQAEEDEDGR